MGLFRKNKQHDAYEEERPGIIVANNPTSIVAEQIRTLRTNLQFSMLGRELKTITVTSATPGSGKSVISANLAAAFAIDGKRVLLVDTDMRKPTVHKTFNDRNLQGLTHLITDDSVELFKTVKRSNVPNLYYLTCGVIPPNPAELLASKRMDQIIEQMKTLFDIIVFDNPPVLAVTDAQVMAAKTDGTVFVIPQGRVNKDEVKEAARLLKNVNANILGGVLNRVDKANDNYYYYYGE